MTRTALRTLRAILLYDGSIEDSEVEILRLKLNDNGTIDQEDIEFLIELRNEAESVCAAFEELLFHSIKVNLLMNRAIDSEKATWLRQKLFTNKWIDKRGPQLLWEIITGANWTSKEFKALYLEHMK